MNVPSEATMAESHPAEFVTLLVISDIVWQLALLESALICVHLR